MNLLEHLLPCWEELVESSGKTDPGLTLVFAIYLLCLSLGGLICPVGIMGQLREGP